MTISCTKPGGWVEFQDWDVELKSEDGTTKGTALERYFAESLNAFEKAGYPTRPGLFPQGMVCGSRVCGHSCSEISCANGCLAKRSILCR